MSKVKETGKQIKAESKQQVSPPTTSSSPFSDLDFMFNRWVNSFFPSAFNQPFRLDTPLLRETGGARAPRIDVIDRDESVIVRAELPGVQKDDLDVTITDTGLTIKGDCKYEESEKTDNYYCCEISRGSFLRTISLPENVDAENAKANFDDGILELTLPKTQKSKRRTIKIE